MSFDDEQKQQQQLKEPMFVDQKCVYHRFQTRFIWRSILWLAVLIALFVSRSALLRYYQELKDHHLLSTFVGSVLVPFLTEAMIGFVLGLFTVSVLSLWAQCKLKQKRWTTVLAIVLLIPIIWLLLDIPSLNLISNQYILYCVLIHDWVQELLFFVFPFSSGILFSLVKE